MEFGPETCILEGPTRLSIWLDVQAATPLLVRIDGEPVPSTGRVIQGGLRLAVEVPEGAEVLRVETPGLSWSPEVTLALEWRERPPIDGLSPEALEAFANESSGWARLRALELLRRTSKGDPAGLSVGEAELALARKLGASQHQAVILGQFAFTYIEKIDDRQRAQTTLNDLKALSQVSPVAAARWEYYNAVLARRAGDLGTALTGFENARALTEQLNYGVVDVLDMLANTLAELGQDTKARSLFRQLEANLWESDPGCSEFVRIANNLAWGQVVLGASGHEHNDPRPLALAALQRIPDCPHSWREAALFLDLALAELEYGQPQEALGWLANIGTVPRNLTGWIEMTSAAAALDLNNPSDQPALVLQPARTSEIELSWNQSVRHGDLLAAWGFQDLAAEAYRTAEDQLSATFERVGTNGGEMYVAGRSASLEGLVRSLVQIGRPSAALCAIRLARTREFARLDRTARLATATEYELAHWQQDLVDLKQHQRAADDERSKLWELSGPDQVQAATKLATQTRRNRERLDDAVRGLGLQPNARSCAELRSPSAGEVILVAFGPYVFARSDSGIEVSPRDELSSLEVLADATLITLLETSMNGLEPLHMSPWRQVQTLIEIAPVGYSLDLPPRTDSGTRSRTALVLSDPRDDLPDARTEADSVSHTLEAKGWNVIDLRGPEAKRSSLVKYASGVDLLHYAGHGVRAGLSGWDSALLLADDRRFGIRDVFALPAVPQGVVLTGCETAAPNPDTIGGGMNIARAFVLAGSAWVIAADAEVADRYAAEVGAAVHASDAQGGPARLREALLRLRADDPELPWQQFRVIIP